MGAHSSAHDLMAGVESDAIRVRAEKYAAILNHWLSTGIAERSPLDRMTSDEVEVLRCVRDVLEVVGHGG